MNIRHIIFFLELMILESSIAFSFERRKYFWVRLLLSTAAFSASMLLLPKRQAPYFLMIVTFAILLVTVLIWCFCCKTSIYNVIFIGVVGHSLEHLINKVYLLVSYCFLPDYITSSPLSYPVATAAMSLIMWFLIGRFFAKRVKANGENIANHKWILLLALMMLAITIVVSVYSNRIIHTTGLLGKIVLSVYAITICVLIQLLLYFIVTHNKLKSDLTISHALINQKNEQFEYSKAAIDLVNIKYHDLKYKLEEAHNSEFGIDDSMLAEIEDAMNIYGTAVKTDNEVLDVILTEKSLFCEKNGIVFSCIADGSQLSFIQTTDLYSLFGNAIDNAIEAVMQLENCNERRISLQIKTVGRFLSIRIENPYKGAIGFKDGLPKTVKRDESYHGYGMKSIKLIVKKHNGTMTISTENDIFVLKIMFPLAELG